MLDYSKNTPAIPPLCKSVADRIICAAQSSEARAAQSDLLNQMTVNEYFPGQGIASHTGFIFTSLLHTIIEFVTLAYRHEIMFWPGHLHLKSGESNRDEVHTKVSVIHDATLHTHQHLPSFLPRLRVSVADGQRGNEHRYVWLPSRSLLVLSGASRYDWSHCISSRKMDKVNGRLINRGRRLRSAHLNSIFRFILVKTSTYVCSLTYRQGLRPGPIPSSLLQSGELEIDHVST